MHKKFAITAGTIVMIGLSSQTMGTASAARPGPVAGAETRGTALGAQQTKKLVRDDFCVEIKNMEKGFNGPTSCEAEVTETVSAATRVTPAMAEAMGNPLTPSGERLVEAASTRPVYYRTWSQDMRGLYYINWYEKHQGLYYFDYTYAWVTPRYGWDSHGYHQCDLGYGVGYDVKVVDCGQRGNMSGNVVVPDTFRVHVIWRGLPIYKTYTMTRNLGANGVIS